MAKPKSAAPQAAPTLSPGGDTPPGDTQPPPHGESVEILSTIRVDGLWYGPGIYRGVSASMAAALRAASPGS